MYINSAEKAASAVLHVRFVLLRVNRRCGLQRNPETAIATDSDIETEFKYWLIFAKDHVIAG